MKLLKFQASWCQPCKVLTASMQGMDIPYPVETVDAQENEDILAKYNIRSVPALVLVNDDGSEIDRLVGASNKDAVIKFLKSNEDF